MRIPKKGRRWIMAALVAGVVWFAWSRRQVSEFTMPDRSIVRIEKVSYGKREPINPYDTRSRRLKAKLVALLPKQPGVKPIEFPTSGGGDWWSGTLVHTNNDALQIQITRRNPKSGEFENADVRFGEIVDSHGCLFRSTAAGGMNYGRPVGFSTIVWLTFEAFPRHEKRFRLRLYDMKHQFMGEMRIANPAPIPNPQTNWNTETLPITKTNGDITFTLKAVSLKTNINARAPNALATNIAVHFSPVFEVQEDGLPSMEWEPVEMELWDSFGNFGSRAHVSSQTMFLCPNVPAWKVVAKFHGSDLAKKASNSVWNIKGVKVPGPGEHTVINATQQMQGLTMKVVALGGAGVVSYSDGAVIGSFTPDPNWVSDSWKRSQGSWDIHGGQPHIAISIFGVTNGQFLTMTNGQRLTVQAQDDAGRKFHGTKWLHGYEAEKAGQLYFLREPLTKGGLNFAPLNLPDNTKTVDLTICLHTPHVVEFIFKPPGPGNKK